MISDVNDLKSRSILKYLWCLFGNPVVFNPVSLEITFRGSRKNIRQAARMLDRERIWYDIGWVHMEGEAYPCRITLRFDKVSLKR